MISARLPRPSKVEKVELLQNGTQQWFTHQLWDVLNYDSLSSLQINRIILSLNAPTIHRSLLYIERNSSSMILRRRAISLRIAQKISHADPFNALTVFLILYSEAVDKEDIHSMGILRKYLIKIMYKIRSLPEFVGAPSIIFDFINHFFYSLLMKNELNVVHQEDLQLFYNLPSQRAHQIRSGSDFYYKAIKSFNFIRDCEIG